MKPHVLQKVLTLIMMGLLMATLVIPAFAQDSPAQITIRVDGLSCPFCAYGLEKKLKRLKGAASVRIDIEHGMAEVTVAEGKTIQESDLKKAVVDAGFTPRAITYRPEKP